METSRVPMGEKNASCDDGKTNITIDWDGYFGDFICSSPRTRIIPDKAVDSVIEFENIPKAYMAPHFCMDTEITYDHQLPTFGPHRPLWPVFGEYKFLPKQRWLHTLEHGGIVALYHPCADLREISLLKKLVKSCLRRYVISPSRELSKERPLALLAWGARYTMSVVYPNAVRKFIRERALRGPEKLPDEGQYTMFLKEQSVVVSDFEDSKLCPDDKM
ncbi:hypothetical protein RUM44_006811 [Polyplax serrata]|uniref:Uncharacterized protein n=1 Tax=Polyplax serrata TaxID=468196 RepID=A0ABR1AJV8_POLSC